MLRNEAMRSKRLRSEFSETELKLLDKLVAAAISELSENIPSYLKVYLGASHSTQLQSKSMSHAEGGIFGFAELQKKLEANAKEVTANFVQAQNNFESNATEISEHKDTAKSPDTVTAERTDLSPFPINRDVKFQRGVAEWWTCS